MNFLVKAVLLDLDGTLLDTAPDLLEAANGMLRDMGRPRIGEASFRQHYAVSNGCHTKLFPGVRQGLESLAARGLPLACVTNKAEVFTLPLLERMGLAGFFQVVVSGDTLPRAKPDPMQLVWVCGRFDLKPKDMLFIGDSVNDVKAARAAGCPVFVVPYGYNEGRGVRGLDSDAIVASIEEATTLISNA